MMENFAVIFDMDGVISDTVDSHTRVETEILEAYGISLSEECLHSDFAGISDIDMFSTILKRHPHVSQSAEELSRIKRERMSSSELIIEPIPHAIELISELHSINVPLAVASGSPKDFVEMTLYRLNLTSIFTSVVSADEVENGKPAPEIFLKAAKDLNFQPSNVVVIEDGRAGLLGAKDAGMRCVALTNKSLQDLVVDIEVTSLSELSATRLAELFT